MLLWHPRLHYSKCILQESRHRSFCQDCGALLLTRMCKPPLPTSFEPLGKRRHVEFDLDGDEEGDNDDDQEQDEETLHRRFLCPDKSISQRIRNLLKVAAEDPDKDEVLEDDEATLSDKGAAAFSKFSNAADSNPVGPPPLPKTWVGFEQIKDMVKFCDRSDRVTLESATRKYQQEAQREAYEPAAGTLRRNITCSEVLDVIARSDTEEGELPVVPGTWVCLQRGKAHRQLAFVLTAMKLYIELPPAPASLHHALLALTCKDPCLALAEGDHVVIVAGKHKGMNGFIAVLRKMWNGQKHQRTEYAKVVLPGYGGAYQIKKEDECAYVELTHLKHAGLNFGYKFLGATGHMVDVANNHLTILIPIDSDVVGATIASSSALWLTMPQFAKMIVKNDIHDINGLRPTALGIHLHHSLQAGSLELTRQTIASGKHVAKDAMRHYGALWSTI
ncbi:hypothetical protein B0H19DRAFT_1062990 [Mycena capillaripes]|nr:hypothetical protein B0H19DRAFT_1062990 [Mycena capillaripes]